MVPRCSRNLRTVRSIMAWNILLLARIKMRPIATTSTRSACVVSRGGAHCVVVPSSGKRCLGNRAVSRISAYHNLWTYFVLIFYALLSILYIHYTHQEAVIGSPSAQTRQMYNTQANSLKNKFAILMRKPETNQNSTCTGKQN